MDVEMINMRWLVLAVLLLFGGCSADLVTFSDQGDMRTLWNAQNVYPSRYKDDLVAFLRTYLNNPEHVRDAGLATPQLKTVGPGERYITCVRFNARNSDGKYKGVKQGAAVYVSGKLDQFIDQPKAVAELCKEASFAPFPELERLTR
jgi:hypothetical protein